MLNASHCNRGQIMVTLGPEAILTLFDLILLLFYGYPLCFEMLFTFFKNNYFAQLDAKQRKLDALYVERGFLH